MAGQTARACLSAAMLMMGLAAWSARVQAQDKPARSYALLSLAGNTISTAVTTAEVGTHFDPIETTRIPITGSVFDEAAIRAASKAIKHIQPDVKVALMVTQDEALYKSQNEMFETPETKKDDREFLKALVKDRGVSHLILITQHRDEVKVILGNTTLGKGKVTGLGFYMDNGVELSSDATGNSAKGLLAPFAYLKVRLIDAETLNVIAEVKATQTDVFSNANRPDVGIPWNTLSGAEKIKLLQDIVSDAMADALPRLLQQ